ncbi:hypothetical protein CC78DRAFT_516192 [Lojkania enalia]|uniref:Uncharacterized protein n=1 Tax=Lojkania enalia TaxID=147567 RepID=A0A9P4KE10_9PLEO|nr:hypothetical protein CC78DRAFT_516192 [Didymosphaeria enalia]
MASSIKGPGMLWVTSRIASSSKDILDEETFMKWYDEDHITEIIATSGINDAFRYIDAEKDSPNVLKPFLAFYPMPDLAFTLGQEFKNIKVKSDILPGTRIIYDMADLDVLYYGLIRKTEARRNKGIKRQTAPYILVSAIKPANGTPDSQVTRFYDQQSAIVSEMPNYIRTLCFKLLYARTNAQSRALKGLPTTDEPAPEPPTWQAVYEFSAEPSSETKATLKDDRSEVLKKAKQNELHVYRLAKVHGGGKFFE